MANGFGKIHDHNIYFYSDALKKHKVLFFNLKNGLDNRCSILYIASGESVLEARCQMAYLGFRFDRPDKTRIVTSREWYTPDGEFNPNRVVEQYRKLLDESLDRGFEGLYVSADAADAFDYLKDDLKSWLKYEASLGRTFDFPMEAVCAYHTDQVKNRNEELLQLVQAHKKTITAETSTILDNQELLLEAVSEADMIEGNDGLKDLRKKLELDASRCLV